MLVSTISDRDCKHGCDCDFNHLFHYPKKVTLDNVTYRIEKEG